MSGTRLRTGPRIMKTITGGLLILVITPVWAVINPDFTPADLVEGASRIVLLRVSMPEGGNVVAESIETLKGSPLSEKRIHLDVTGGLDTSDVATAFRPGAASATAVLVLSKPRTGQAEGTVSGALQIETRWFAVSFKDRTWSLKPDEQQLFAVWGGNARQLGEAARYVLEEDSDPEFPVRSDLSWRDEWRIGSPVEGATGCLPVDFGEPLGSCVVVFSESGDRVYRLSGADGPPRDITGSLSLTTRSHARAFGDFNGDGRLDLASWDGSRLHLALQTDQGTFASRPLDVELSDCRSLETLHVGSDSGAGLLAATSRGPVLLVPGGAGGFQKRVLDGSEPDGAPSALMTAVDLDGDGPPDVLEVRDSALVVYPGADSGRFKDPIRSPVRGVKDPCHAVFGDYDTDGRLDIVVAGAEGFALLSRLPDGRWENTTYATGELQYHGNANRPVVVQTAPCDVNLDGRQGLALFYSARKPMLFFNRGFACFGLARELDLTGAASLSSESMDPFAPVEPEMALEAAEALQSGQTAGTIADLNSDGAPDLLAVNRKGEVWALLGELRERPPLMLQLILSPRLAGPLTIKVHSPDRLLGMHCIRAGTPARVGLPEPGPVILEWAESDGKPRRVEVIVERSHRFEITRNEGTSLPDS